MPETNDTNQHTVPRHDTDPKQAEEARRRSAGEAFDKRMEDLTRDGPKAPRPDQDRRRRR
ncbi:MAG TPA: hypothetical protein VMW62_16240 [Chloroflexota bacterium]|nr:hypothetical protein [Chloroflexota bacterium]